MWATTVAKLEVNAESVSAMVEAEAWWRTTTRQTMAARPMEARR